MHVPRGVRFAHRHLARRSLAIFVWAVCKDGGEINTDLVFDFCDAGVVAKSTIRSISPNQ